MSFRFGLGIRIMSNLFFNFSGSFFASPSARVITFCNLFSAIIFFASLFAFLFSSFEIIIAFFFFSFNFFAITIGYGEIPANITRIFVPFFFVSFSTSSAITFLSFDNLGEKYDSSTLNLKIQLFSL